MPTIINTPIPSTDTPWENYSGQQVENFIKAQLAEAKDAAAAAVQGVIVNNTEAARDANGKVNINVPSVTTDVTNPSNANAAQAGAVASEINAINSNLIAGIQLGNINQDGSMIELNFFNAANDKLDDLTVMIPAAQEVGEIIQPVITTELRSAARIKLGDSIILNWGYDCLRKFEGESESVDYPAQTVAITVKIGTTTVYTETHPQVPVGTTETLTLGGDIINQAGTVSISVVATTPIDEEVKTSRGSKSVTVITMELATTFDPASQLALSNGFTDGQTISIPYTYTVPVGTTLSIWVDGELYATNSISGTGRNLVSLTASTLGAGRHNVQMIAESAGLLSNAVSVDVLKAGGTADYLGIRMKTDVGQPSDMPLPYAYGATPLPLSVSQFEGLELDVAAWNGDTLTSTIVVSVDGVTTQTLTADRTLQTISQRFDTAGSHTMVIALGNGTVTAYRTFGVTVNAAAGVTESEAVGYHTKLTATGRSNGEASPADWGGITTFTGVDWRTNGWNRGSDGVDALLLTNGATAEIDVKPFVLDASDGDYSIQSKGMTLEMEVMVSQVMERGATVLSCLCDNDGNGYPMGIKVTTEEAGLFFGGVEEITTAEDLVDANGNYIDYDGNIVDEDHAVKLKVTRPHGVSMNIAVGRWVHLAFVVQPAADGYGLGMLFINGVLSRANRYTGSLRQDTPAGITIDSDKADVRIRGLRYYRTPLNADEVLGNWIIDRPTAALIQGAHANNAVGDSNNTTDGDGNIAIDHDTLLRRGRGILTVIRSDDTASDVAAAGTGTGLSELFRSTNKRANFKADLVRWEPPLDANGNPIGEGFEARNIRMRIQGTSSVKYPYKNFRIYLTTQQGTADRSLAIGGVDVTETASGYPLRGSGNSIGQAVICAKTDFVDSSLVMNTGGAHLFNDIMRELSLDTPPQAYDARVRQAIDGLPCDVYAGTDENGALTYCGQFVLNNEKSKSSKIFGMEGVKDSNGNEVDFRRYENGTVVIDTKPLALEALTNSSPMTLFQSAGPANSAALANQLAAEFDDGFEFNHPEDAKWDTIGTVNYADWGGAQTAIKRLFGWIYECMAQTAGVLGGTMTTAAPDYGTTAGWSDASKAKWVSAKFKTEASQYFNVNHLLTYYLFTDYWASVDQRAKNILWRTWDGLIWYATFYDGDTAMSIRNDAFMVYLYNVTRDSYDEERSKYAFEGHGSWLWCLVLANFEDELKSCAARLRNQLTTQVMLNEFNTVMQGNWSERQYNKSGKLKYIDTIETMNYVYTLTGNRELHRTQFLTDRARLLDARYGAGVYEGDVITFTVVRNASATPSHLTLKSGDLYYFGYKLNGLWLQGPSRAAAGESLTLDFTGTLATNDPLMLGGASCISELDLTQMGSQLNGTVGLSLCTMLSKLIMPATNGVANAPLTLGDTAKLEYVDITGQTAVHTGTTGVFDLSKHTRLTTLLAGGTSLTNIKLPEGSPLQTLVMPSTLQTLTLRYLPRLTHSGLTLQGTANIKELNFAECPNLSWQTLLTMCPNIDHVRIEGMSGRVRSAMLRPFMSGYYGLTATGAEQTYPALIGKVQLVDVVDDFATMQRFFALCGLELVEAQYSEYIFHDLSSDPANITNTDNQTGYAYRENDSGEDITHPNGYQASGHVALLHDMAMPVRARYAKDATTQVWKMKAVPLNKEDFRYLADGTTPSEIDGGSIYYDFFLHLPKYHYKGINYYRRATKHLFLSTLESPLPSYTTRLKLTLADIQAFDPSTPLSPSSPLTPFAPLTPSHSTGKAVAYEDATIGYTIPLTANTTHDTYRLPVKGMKLVRFPSLLSPSIGSAFTTDDGTVIEKNRLQSITDETDSNQNATDSSPIDLDPTTPYGYDILPVPEGAAYLYFTAPKTTPTDAPAIATDSDQVESLEDWVTHSPELIGLWQATKDADGNMRSTYKSGQTNLKGTGNTGTAAGWASGGYYDSDGGILYDGRDNYPIAPPTISYYTPADLLNLARLRGPGFHAITYETSKDLANILMAWFGTREIESIVGAGLSGTNSYTPGANRYSGTQSRRYHDSTGFAQANGINIAWGMEALVGVNGEAMDDCCFNAPSFKTFLKYNRAPQSAWTADYIFRIRQADGTERSIQTGGNGAGCVARTHFGQRCDIVNAKRLADTTYSSFYAARQENYVYVSSTGRRGGVPIRGGSDAAPEAGMAYTIHREQGHSQTTVGTRLCYTGPYTIE